MKIIKVVFLLKSKAPLNIKQIEYFVMTENYDIAYNKALDQLILDVEKQYLRYYDNIAMCEINLIRNNDG